MTGKEKVPRIVRRLSQHCVSRWRKRVEKEVPSAEELNAMILEGVRLTAFEKLYRKEGKKTYKPVKRLGVYWIPERSIIVWVDEDRGTAVTIISDVSCRRVR